MIVRGGIEVIMIFFFTFPKAKSDDVTKPLQEILEWYFKNDVHDKIWETGVLKSLKS